jgi:hypothetical protein
MGTGDVGQEHSASVRLEPPAGLDALLAAFQAAHERACPFRRKDTGVEDATATTVVRAGQRAAIDRFSLPPIEGAG